MERWSARSASAAGPAIRIMPSRKQAPPPSDRSVPSAASDCYSLPQVSVPERFAGFQHVHHARLSLLTPAKTQERFAFKIEEILFGDLWGSREAPATQHMGEFLADEGVVIGNVAALPRHPDAHLHQGKTLLA